VFEQAYIRFMDLKKAEAQAREAKIEVALERVRARAMAMHQTDELTDVLCVLFDQFDFLGINPVLTHLTLMDEENETFSLRITTTAENRIVAEQFIDINAVDAWKDSFANWKKSEPNAIDCIDYPPEALPMVWEVLGEVMDALPKGHKIYPKDFPDGLYTTQGHFKFGYIGFNHKRRATDEEKSIVVRFAKEFGRTYQRFLDLQKAEAQAREAQIEAALERVRSKSMAMHKSDELLDVITVVSEQLIALDFKFSHVSFANNNIDEKYKFWSSAKGKTQPMRFSVPFLNLTVFNNIRKAQKKSASFLTDIITKEEHNNWHNHLLKHGGSAVFSKTDNAYIMSKGMARSIAINPNIMLILANYASIPYSDAENKIIERFGQVFEQSYTRFLDLQRAEKQTREAQIENALEKVRSRSLAMHQSEELWDVINEIFGQLEVLKIQTDSCFINIYQDENPGDLKCYIAAGGQTYKHLSYLPYSDIKIFNKLIEARKNEERFYSIIMDKEEKELWWKHFFAKATNIKVPTKRKNYIAKTTGLTTSVVLGEYASIHMLKYVASPYLEEENQILRRFGNAFDQVYTRFLDLQKAEAQARESLIEASLERVRSRTLAMQNSEELAQTSVVVFQQLLELGIAPNRLFIGIIKDQDKKIDAWATTEDGSKLAKHFTLEAAKNKSIKKMFDGWKRKKKSLVIDMKGNELQDYFQYLNKDMDIPFIHGLKQKRRVQTIAYFSGGLIGMAAPEEQPEETIKLLERFAAVFNLTYTRFNDLKVSEAQTKKAEEDLIKLQAAKKSAEDALSELQTTQTQLIQSEKMASLGELTAGIAHEIQNPLNFVNNFSEVSKELLEEMLEEIENGDMEEVRAIMDDVIQNLEKINHHGKRADGIVKGMLQHSRSSTGKKEPTNINVIADEYLRLAYHGLRAKDKSFNATLVTDFDDTIGNINVLPQDIGRVILNLLTNAFYVVNEKSSFAKTSEDKYEPTVSLTTKKKGNLVSISVKDNGNGIPKHVLEKIFQPFFTTKPTGQGTGLGLSMSYDIVTKGHGGELKVSTEQNKGTEFIIILPVN
jgi:signal transduction histidine kinase